MSTLLGFVMLCLLFQKYTYHITYSARSVSNDVSHHKNTIEQFQVLL